MSDVPNRITGMEMEWGITVPTPRYSALGRPLKEADIRQLDVVMDYDEIKQRKRAYVSSADYLGDGNYFLGNGAKYYDECIGPHVEYATPEDDSFNGTTANEMAGERTLFQTLNSSYELANGSVLQPIPGLSLNKRVIGDDGVSWGCHENYLVDATTGIQINEYYLALLGVHMATRNIFFGAGLLRTNGQYVLAQKALDLKHDFKNGTTGMNKPVVNLRNEPHADRDEWLRVHVTSGDATMSPWATRMKLGTTSLVLRLIEHREYLSNIRFATDLHQIGKQIAADTSLKNRHELAGEGAMTAVQVQQQLVRAAGRLASRVSLPEEELWTLDQWEKACSDIQQNPELLRDRADWVIKKLLLERAHERLHLDWKSPEMRGVERRWDKIDINGAGIAMRQNSLSKWMPSESLIDERMTTPPQTTRARIRGEFISAFSGQNALAKVDWGLLKYNNEVIKLDPYLLRHEKVERIIRQSAA